jgi:hypothetical protein
MASNLDIHRTLEAISTDLDLAVAFYETYVPSGQDPDLINYVNDADLYPAFNVISDALHRNVIMALCRVWDTRADTANLNRLADEFRDSKVLAEPERGGDKIDATQLRKWLAEIDALNKSDELLALRRARHRALAHTATPNEPYKGRARVAEFGDERRLIEKTIPLVEQAGAFIGYSYAVPFYEQRRIRCEHSRKFWEHVCQRTR